MECCLAGISGCVEYGGERASCGGVPRGRDLALLNTVVVEVIIIVVAVVSHSEHFIDIVAVDVPCLYIGRRMTINLGQYLPVLAHVVPPGSGGLAVAIDDLFDPPAEGVVGVCRLGGFAQFDLDDTVLIIVDIRITPMVACEVVGIVAANLAPSPLGFFSQLQSNRKKEGHKYISCR